MRTHRISLSIALVMGLFLTAACGSDDTTSDPFVPPADSFVPFPAGPTTTDIGQVVEDIGNEVFIYQPMLEEILAFWNAQYDVHTGAAGSEVNFDFLTGNESTECGPPGISEMITAQSNLGPIYCPYQDIVIIPTAMTTNLVNGEYFIAGENQARLTPSGEVGVFFLIAHEMGHNVQYEVLGAEEMAKRRDVDIENGADCLAGVAIAGVARVFDTQDVNGMLTLANEIGEPEGKVHGTPQQRVEALKLGMLRDYADKAAINQGFIDCFEKYMSVTAI